MAYQNLFDYMANNFGLSLLQQDMQEIERMVELDKKEYEENIEETKAINKNKTIRLIRGAFFRSINTTGNPAKTYLLKVVQDKKEYFVISTRHLIPEENSILYNKLGFRIIKTYKKKCLFEKDIVFKADSMATIVAIYNKLKKL